MTNQEKQIKDLQKKIETLTQLNEAKDKKLDELEAEIELFKEPINIENIFDVLPVNDCANLLHKIESNLFGKVASEIEVLENKTGLLKNNLELIKSNSKVISEGRLYKKF